MKNLKTIILVLVCVLSLGLAPSASQADEVGRDIWNISNVKEVPSGYDFTLVSQNSTPQIGVDVHLVKRQMDLLARAYGIDPKQDRTALNGKCISVAPGRYNIHHVLDMTILREMYHGKYVAPSTEEVQDQAAAALAALAQPDFWNVDEQTVTNTFKEAFDEDGKIYPLWVTLFSEKVSLASDGKVKLVQTSDAHFDLVYDNGKRHFEQPVSFTPTSHPFTFE